MSAVLPLILSHMEMSLRPGTLSYQKIKSSNKPVLGLPSPMGMSIFLYFRHNVKIYLLHRAEGSFHCDPEKGAQRLVALYQPPTAKGPVGLGDLLAYPNYPG